MPTTKAKPKLAVWKFSSCDGCQLSLLDCEDELFAVAGAFEIAYFLEATRTQAKGPYDVSLVEGSIANEADLERLKKIRADSAALITIGACATAGGPTRIHRQPGNFDGDCRPRESRFRVAVGLSQQPPDRGSHRIASVSSAS